MGDKKIFIDSNFFVALFNPQDSLYHKAVSKSGTIRQENPLLYISNFIFLEIVTIISQRVNRKTAILLGKNILEDRKIEIIYVDRQLNDLSWVIFQKIQKKNMSFVDCSSLAILKMYQIKDFLTFDREDFSGFEKVYKFNFY